MNYQDNSGREKRRHIRVPFRETIQYYFISESASERKTFEAKGINLSVGGLMFLSREKFKPYEDLHLEFHLEYADQKVEMSVWGQVAWLEELESNVLYNAGVKFQNLSQSQKDTIAEFVKHSLKID